MKIDRGLLLCLVFLTQGCGLSIFSTPKTQPSILQIIEAEPDAVAASVATTIERRIFLVGLNGDAKGKFCAEPPPDAAENIASTFSSALTASADGMAANPEISQSIGQSVASAVQDLSKRSQGVILFRDGMFNLCQSHLNGIIGNSEYKEQSQKLLELAVKLIDKEIEKSGGKIGPTPKVVEAVAAGQSQADLSAAAIASAGAATETALNLVEQGKIKLTDAPQTAREGAEAGIAAAASQMQKLSTPSSTANTIGAAIQKSTEVVKEQAK